MKKHKYIDITLDLSEDLPLWTGSAGMQLEFLQKITDNNPANVSQLTIELHTGTHIDAPLHFVNNGKSVEKLELETLIGEAWVIYLPDLRQITAQDLENADIPTHTTRLLLKTDNSKLWQTKPYPVFQKDFVALTSDAAQWIVDKEIKLVGIDYLSIQRYSDSPKTHQILLEAEVVILETIDLSNVNSGEYELICLPLKIKDAEASPVRAVLKMINT